MSLLPLSVMLAVGVLQLTLGQVEAFLFISNVLSFIKDGYWTSSHAFCFYQDDRVIFLFRQLLNNMVNLLD